jgi:hypothetical protein
MIRKFKNLKFKEYWGGRYPEITESHKSNGIFLQFKKSARIRVSVLSPGLAGIAEVRGKKSII